MADIDPTILRKLLRYDPETGTLYWIRRPVSMFTDGKQPAEQNCNIWNGKFADKPALNAVEARGSRGGHLLRRHVKAHRVIWALVHGEWPQGEIDHINGDPADNRLTNLRDVSHRENGRNLKLKKNNKTGACGVTQRPSGRWVAKAMVDGKSVTIGTFDTLEQASEARKAAEPVLGFHENHGAAR